MEPTIEAELSAVRRCLAELAARDDVPEAVGVVLSELGRSLRLVERSWSKRLPYLLADNDRLGALLGDLAPDTGELAPVIGEALDDLAEQARRDGPSLDPAAADRSNRVLRSLLATTIAQSARSDESVQADICFRARTVLAESLQARPW
jgi:hypothetical protein